MFFIIIRPFSIRIQTWFHGHGLIGGTGCRSRRCRRCGSSRVTRCRRGYSCIARCWCRSRRRFRGRSRCYCGGSYYCRGCCWRTHRSSKAGFIILFADLLHFRTLQRDNAAGAGVLHFHCAGTHYGINLLRVIRSTRVRVCHLVICGGTPANKKTGAKACYQPSILHRFFHHLSFHLDTAIGLRMAWRAHRSAPSNFPQQAAGNSGCLR